MTYGVYIHIPFCRRKCLYCDFASYPGREEAFSRYVCLLKKEIGQRLSGDDRIDTVFIGGGTPTVLPARTLGWILDSVREHGNVLPDAEITVEMNPGTVTAETLRELRSCGVNRVSIGVQSFSDCLLQKLGRIHTAGQAADTVRTAREAGFDNISLDLMYGIPGQSVSNWEETIDTALGLPVTHLSCYSLIVEEGTPYAEMQEKGELELPGEEDILAMEAYTRDTLSRAGFSRYEVSNYARPGYESRHNLKYWKREPYIGLGCAAHSFIAGERISNTADPDQYMRNMENGTEEGNTCTRIDAEEAAFEEIMLGFRMTEGIQLSETAYRKYRDKMEAMERDGYLVLNGKHVRLTERGMDVMNTLLTQFLAM